MSLYLTRFPASESAGDWIYLFDRYGPLKDVSYVHPYWRIDFEDARDAADALRNEQGRKINGVRLVLTDKRPGEFEPTDKVELSSLRLFIGGEVTLTNGAKLNIEPVEINIPIKY